MPFDRAAAKKELSRLEQQKARVSKRIATLERRLHADSNRRLMREYVRKAFKIDWEGMNWPFETCPLPNGPPITCIVCFRVTRGERYLTGGPPGREGGTVDVHKACVPQRVLDRLSAD